MKNLRIFMSGFFLCNIRMSYRALSTYRAATLLKLCSTALAITIYLFLWQGIFGEEEVLNNFTLGDLLLFVILVRVMRVCYPFNVSNSYSQLVKSGNILTWLLKPISIETRLFSQSIGNSLYNAAFVGIPSLILIPLFVQVHPVALGRIILFCVWFLLAYIFVFLFELTIGLISYHTTSLWGINQFKSAIVVLMSGELLPLSLYPEVMHRVLSYLPFSSIYYIPISIVLNRDLENIIILFMILLTSIISLLIFYSFLSKKMIKKIMIQGG